MIRIQNRKTNIYSDYDDDDYPHIWFELSGLPIEGVCQLPGGHDGDVHREEHGHHQEQLRVLHHLIITMIMVMFCLQKQCNVEPFC